ncbi:MAG: hypothetical protein PHH11_08720 [Methylomonas sp.]|nr:hypothetical protein [Methylomonas sp.]
MLQTVEAIYDPKQGLAFKEAVNVTGPVKVLVTFVEPSSPASPAKGSASALMAALKQTGHRIPLNYPTPKSMPKFEKCRKVGSSPVSWLQGFLDE